MDKKIFNTLIRLFEIETWEIMGDAKFAVKVVRDLQYSDQVWRTFNMATRPGVWRA